ncbi:hypothetical protein GGI07_003640 [Coemansia sp. Benny D115]|nr:hypothetical protein GGI07_003640 [Coemansia sp. Benny D115]
MSSAKDTAKPTAPAASAEANADPTQTSDELSKHERPDAPTTDDAISKADDEAAAETPPLSAETLTIDGGSKADEAGKAEEPAAVSQANADKNSDPAHKASAEAEKEITSAAKTGTKESAEGGASDQEDFADGANLVDAAVGELAGLDIGVDVAAQDVPPLSPTGTGGQPRVAVKTPTASHPLQQQQQQPVKSGFDASPVDMAISGPSPAEVASAILLKDSEAARAFGAGGFGGSGESDRTAIGRAMSSQISPRSSGSNPGKQHEITELSEGENDQEYDAQEAAEERQRRLFYMAERRRQQKEKMSQTVLSSDEVEAVRSGFASAQAHAEPSELRILNGSYPESLRGSMYFVGPGRFEVKYNVQRELEQATRMFSFGHLMDTLPLLSKVSFDPKEKKIEYRSRLIAKQLAGRIQSEHGVNTKVPGALYKTATNQTFLNKFIPKAPHYSTPEGECCGQDIQLFMPLQGSNQTIVCTNHVGALQNIDPVDLQPRAIVELKDVNPEFKGAHSCPHMQYDSDTREHFTVLQDVGFRSTTYTVVAISESQPDGYVVASFVAQASVLHSFAITQDYVIVPVYPYTAPIGGLSYRWGDSLLETLTFDNTQPVHFYVISREYRRVQCVYETPPFFALHQINATQESATDSVVIDTVAYEDDLVLRQLQIKNLRKPSVDFAIPSGYARRFLLNGVTMEATKYVEAKGRPTLLPPAHSLLLRTESVELARINPMVATRPYTFVYGLSHVERLRGLPSHVSSTTMFNCIVKLNVADPAAAPLVWTRTHCYPSEPVYVPLSDKEDEGYVISVFFDSMRIASCLLVLDAKTLKEVMIAQLPSPVPLSFGHSKFTI